MCVRRHAIFEPWLEEVGVKTPGNSQSQVYLELKFPFPIHPLLLTFQSSDRRSMSFILDFGCTQWQKQAGVCLLHLKQDQNLQETFLHVCYTAFNLCDTCHPHMASGETSEQIN